MRSKKKRSDPSRLCVIIDCGILDEKKAIGVSRAAAKAGCDMLQLRCKEMDILKAIKIARVIKTIALRQGIPLVINDRAEVAAAIGAHGLHIGRGDISAELAGRILKNGSIIGVSVRTLSEARSARGAQADYIGVGPVFKTPIKEMSGTIGIKILKKIRSLGVPLFAIGGIDSNNIGTLVSNGFRNIAVIRAVLMAEDPFRATLGLKEALS